LFVVVLVVVIDLFSLVVGVVVPVGRFLAVVDFVGFVPFSFCLRVN